MKTWQFWVIVLVVIFVIVPLVYFAIVAKSVVKVAESPLIVSGINPELQNQQFPKLGGICGPNGCVAQN